MNTVLNKNEKMLLVVPASLKFSPMSFLSSHRVTLVMHFSACCIRNMYRYIEECRAIFRNSKYKHDEKVPSKRKCVVLFAQPDLTSLKSKLKESEKKQAKVIEANLNDVKTYCELPTSFNRKDLLLTYQTSNLNFSSQLIPFLPLI